MSTIKENISNLQNLLSAVNALPNAGSGGIELPTLTNEGSTVDLLSGKQLIDQEGNKVIGTMPDNGAILYTMDGINTKSITVPAGYTSGGTVSLDNTIDNEVDIQADLIVQITTTLQNKAAGGEQATPVISVGSNGLITATAGTKSSTHQLAFQPAKTITPTTASQIAVSSGYYTGGDITVAAVPTQTKSVTPKAVSQNVTPDSGKFLSKVTVAGDSNLVAENIKNGVSIFGVNGTLVSGSDELVDYFENEDAIISGIISNYTNNRITSIGAYAFYGYSNLLTASFPSCTQIGPRAFYLCDNLTTISFPVCTSIGSLAFYNCSKLSMANFPSCRYIYNYAFEHCYNLTTISFPVCRTINSSVFYSCYNLSTASFPSCTWIGAAAFRYCDNLTTISFPVCSYICDHTFHNCSKLSMANFPVCSRMDSYVFYSCYNLSTASFPSCTYIGSLAFCYCYNLKSLYLTGSSICTLSHSNAFFSTPIGGYSASAGTYGSIYVPASLLTSYQTATNWTYFSSRFVGI